MDLDELMRIHTYELNMFKLSQFRLALTEMLQIAHCENSGTANYCGRDRRELNWRSKVYFFKTIVIISDKSLYLFYFKYLNNRNTHDCSSQRFYVHAQNNNENTITIVWYEYG
jgi:hypothetical protein